MYQFVFALQEERCGSEIPGIHFLGCFDLIFFSVALAT